MFPGRNVMSSKKELKYLQEKIDLSGVDRVYLTILIAVLSVMLGLIINERFAFTMPLAAVESLILAFVSISIIYEVKSAFSGDLEDKIKSWFLIILGITFMGTLLIIYVIMFLIPDAQLYPTRIIIESLAVFSIFYMVSK